MAVYPSQTIFQLYSGSYTDISSDVIEESKLIWGFSDNSPKNRIANIGTAKIKLRNSAGTYTDFDYFRNKFLRIVIIYDGEVYVKFFGRIVSAKPKFDIQNFPTVEVLAVDWLDSATKFSLTRITSKTQKTLLSYQNDVNVSYPVEQILNASPGKVFLDESISDSYENFYSVFDSIQDKTTAFAEISKIANSEVGLAYLRKSKENGQRFVFEDALYRRGTDELSPVPLETSLSGKMLMETGDYLLLETGSKILLNQTETSDFSANTLLEMEVNNPINQFTVKCYPKEIGTSAVDLFTLDKPFAINSGQTVTIRVDYKDGDTQIGGTGIIAPVSGTDYSANTQEDGGGSNVSAYLGIVQSPGATDCVYTIENSYGATVYIVLLKVRGYPIYRYNPTELLVEDSTSIDENGQVSLVLDQPYQINSNWGKPFANKFLNEFKDVKNRVKAITFYANENSHYMGGFLALDVGSKIQLSNTQAGIDSKHFYIYKIETEIRQGEIIKITWYLEEAPSLSDEGLSLITLQMNGFNGKVDYGLLPYLNDMEGRTWCGWVKLDDNTAGVNKVLMANFDDASGNMLYIKGGTIYFYSKGVTAPHVGIYYGSSSLSTGVWYHVAMTRTGNLDTDTPKLYLNGLEESLTTAETQVGDVTETGNFTLGGVYTTSLGNAYTMNGTIKDCRVYNRVLTQDELATIWTNGAGDLSNVEDLLFLGPCVDTNYLSDYIGSLSNAKVLENQFRMVGLTDGSTGGYI